MKVKTLQVITLASCFLSVVLAAAFILGYL